MGLQGPPRMAMFRFEGREHFVSLPITYEKAITAANELFKVNASTHFVRLSVPAHNVPWIGGYASTADVYIFDGDSYAYACAMKHVVPIDVHIVEKNPAPAAPRTVPVLAKPAAAPKPAAPAGGDGDGNDRGKGKEAPPAKPAEKKEVKTAPFAITVKTAGGKPASVSGTVSGELAQGPSGKYLGVMSIDAATHAQTFHGQQLPGDVEPEKIITQDKSVSRLIFRPRSTRPQIDVYSHESRSLEVTLSVKDWVVTSTYPLTTIKDDKGRQKIKWFLSVRPNGVVKDLLTYTEASGVFLEMIPAPVPKPKETKPEGPLVPAWPEVTTANAWCLLQEHFTPHMERVLASLGLPPHSRTAMITGWLPSVMRYKNIAYRILTNDQLEPSIALDLCPRPQLLLRIYVLWRGIPDSEIKEWKGRTITQHETGLDWRRAVGYSDALLDETLFRVMEYSSMEVFT